MLDRIDCEINVELRPVQMTRLRTLYPEDRRNRGVLEPRKLFEWEEALSIIDEQPEAMRRDVRNFNSQRCHLYLSLLTAGPQNDACASLHSCAEVPLDVFVSQELASVNGDFKVLSSAA
jgi:hypothetical protein